MSTEGILIGHYHTSRHDIMPIRPHLHPFLSPGPHYVPPSSIHTSVLFLHFSNYLHCLSFNLCTCATLYNSHTKTTNHPRPTDFFPSLCLAINLTWVFGYFYSILISVLVLFIFLSAVSFNLRTCCCFMYFVIINTSLIIWYKIIYEI